MIFVSTRSECSFLWQMSKAMADIAQKCIEMNGYSDKVTVIQKHSTDLVVGVDLPSRVDIVVTELVDSGA